MALHRNTTELPDIRIVPNPPRDAVEQLYPKDETGKVLYPDFSKHAASPKPCEDTLYVPTIVPLTEAMMSQGLTLSGPYLAPRRWQANFEPHLGIRQRIINGYETLFGIYPTRFEEFLRREAAAVFQASVANSIFSESYQQQLPKKWSLFGLFESKEVLKVGGANRRRQEKTFIQDTNLVIAGSPDLNATRAKVEPFVPDPENIDQFRILVLVEEYSIDLNKKGVFSRTNRILEFTRLSNLIFKNKFNYDGFENDLEKALAYKFYQLERAFWTREISEKSPCAIDLGETQIENSNTRRMRMAYEEAMCDMDTQEKVSTRRKTVNSTSEPYRLPSAFPEDPDLNPPRILGIARAVAVIFGFRGLDSSEERGGFEIRKKRDIVGGHKGIVRFINQSEIPHISLETLINEARRLNSRASELESQDSKSTKDYEATLITRALVAPNLRERLVLFLFKNSEWEFIKLPLAGAMCKLFKVDLIQAISLTENQDMYLGPINFNFFRVFDGINNEELRRWRYRLSLKEMLKRPYIPSTTFQDPIPSFGSKLGHIDSRGIQVDFSNTKASVLPTLPEVPIINEEEVLDTITVDEILIANKLTNDENIRDIFKLIQSINKSDSMTFEEFRAACANRIYLLSRGFQNSLSKSEFAITIPLEDIEAVVISHIQDRFAQILTELNNYKGLIYERSRNPTRSRREVIKQQIKELESNNALVALFKSKTKPKSSARTQTIDTSYIDRIMGWPDSYKDGIREYVFKPENIKAIYEGYSARVGYHRPFKYNSYGPDDIRFAHNNGHSDLLSAIRKSKEYAVVLLSTLSTLTQ